MTQKQPSPFFNRFAQYLKERFPLLKNGVVIAIFTFSAISYSILSRDEVGFIDISDYLIGIFETISFFLLVRLFDEQKDKVEDAKYRPYLPVPRGLVSLKELRNTAWFIILLQLAVILIFQPRMIWLHLLILAFLLLMRVEFFVPKWLKKRQLAYITSHMLIIPLIDLYASGLDWLLTGAGMHLGLAWFFAVSYFNGLTLEFGRKIRTKDTEEEGVVSYTSLYGRKGGVVVWAGTMLLTLLLALGAANYASFGVFSFILLIVLFIVCFVPGILFISEPTAKRSKFIELSSAIWTAFMYLILGAAPMIKQLLT